MCGKKMSKRWMYCLVHTHVCTQFASAQPPGGGGAANQATCVACHSRSSDVELMFSCFLGWLHCVCLLRFTQYVCTRVARASIPISITVHTCTTWTKRPAIHWSARATGRCGQIMAVVRVECRTSEKREKKAQASVTCVLQL